MVRAEAVEGDAAHHDEVVVPFGVEGGRLERRRRKQLSEGSGHPPWRVLEVHRVQRDAQRRQERRGGISGRRQIGRRLSVCW
jgi:hypothetical protein